MIFLTVGGQLPFDRLVKLVDDSAAAFRSPVFAQIGSTAYKPVNLEYTATLGPADFVTRLTEAKVVIAHAGVGTVIKAGQHHKPIVIVPRRSAFREHRNDHQLATAKALADTPGVFVSMAGDDLVALVNELLLSPVAAVGERSVTLDSLLRAIAWQIERP